ncbi:MAG: acyl-CoA dehydrogenase family protein [Anaerolineae bacterium]|nr:acyl-CoA dehydrogenase family protein [Anaerolineae bacterium]
MSVAEITRTAPTKLESTDYYHMDDLLTDQEREVRYRVREFMMNEVEPIINDYWERGEMPMELLPKLRALGITGGPIPGYGCPGLSSVSMGLISMELSRGDGSLSTIYGVHSGLAMLSIFFLGSEEQKQKYLPKMASWETIGCFGLTEARGGSDAAHPETTARREGDSWVINGNKRWIGLANIADFCIVWARNEETGKVNGFIVPSNTPGYKAVPITGKIGKRAITNCDIYLDNVAIPLENKLENSNSFRDTAIVLGATRIGVAWEAIGHAMAAYEYALDYAKRRVQFGKAIAGYQLTQSKLVNMLGKITAMQMMTLRLSQLIDQGKVTEGKASLAKAFNTANAREVVALGREILGGNGILLENHIARHFADMEAVYTYEGTHDINTLVVGREITGVQAFA